jgi:2-dehydro-3-deoxy-D-gluconate 5-dehydrogenase
VSAQPGSSLQELAPGSLFELKEEVVLLTGAAGGLGGVLARGLGAAGARLALTDHPAKQPELEAIAAGLRDQNVPVTTYYADLADGASYKGIVDAAIEAHDSVDALVNCAGINVRQRTRDITPEAYDAIMNVNLRPAVFLTQAALRYMRLAGRGSVVHMGSINSARALAGVGLYGATKAALSQLARVQAVEEAPYGIRVNCLAPGFLQTALAEPLLTHPVRGPWIRNQVPLGGAGAPEELIGPLLLLVSPAGSYITGQTLYVEGGFLSGSDWDNPHDRASS